MIDDLESPHMEVLKVANHTGVSRNCFYINNVFILSNSEAGFCECSALEPSGAQKPLGMDDHNEISSD